MTKYPAHHLLERQENKREAFLKEAGWDHIMWRWFWVWHKKVHDCEFNCMTAAQAFATEKAIEETQDNYLSK